MKIYEGIAYRQSQDEKAPWLVSFVAPCEEILEWASIPRRTENIELGFQRIAVDAKVTKARDFFQTASLNQSPTAIVLGIHPGLATQKIVTLQFEDDSNLTIRKCRLHVNTALLPLTISEQIQAIRLQIESRLSKEPESSEVYEESVDIDDEGTGLPDEESDSQTIELGRSQLHNLLDKLNEPGWCVSNQENLAELSKPATIIDGQHRILGAASCERNIPFAFCAIYDCKWEEQVYQFTVVNYTSDKILDQFITANAALSLTGSELEVLQTRLVQAGVKVVEYDIMRVVNFDSDSPFFEKVNISEKQNAELIGYKTMIQIARSWYSGRNPAIKLIIQNLYPDISNSSKKLEAWKEREWGNFFQTFWKTVQKTYENTFDRNGKSLWMVGSQLMIAVVLLELQEVFLKNLNAQDQEYFEVKQGVNPLTHLLSQVERRASKVMQYIPDEFFLTEWKLTSLNIGPGKKTLKNVLNDLVDKKGKMDFKKSGLITGHIS